MNLYKFYTYIQAEDEDAAWEEFTQRTLHPAESVFNVEELDCSDDCEEDTNG